MYATLKIPRPTNTQKKTKWPFFGHSILHSSVNEITGNRIDIFIKQNVQLWHEY